MKVEEDKITVLPDDGATEITVAREVWENKKYYLDDKKEIKEDVVGRYEQFPLRLAWAVTIHKSQGLTFDRVIIDAGQSFTNGQVYVALSRCRTLEGIVLKSAIKTTAIFKDTRIADFHTTTNASEKIEAIYEAEKNDFAVSKLLRALGIASLHTAIEQWINAGMESYTADQEDFVTASEQIQRAGNQLETVFTKFEVFVAKQSKSNAPDKWERITEKSRGAVNYFFEQVHQQLFIPLKDHYSITKSVKGLKTYNAAAKALFDELQEYLGNLKTIRFLDQTLLTGREDTVIETAVVKKPSHLISYELLEEGKTVTEIAALRNLAESTIYGHFAKIATTGIMDMEKLFSREQIDTFSSHFAAGQWASLTDAKAALPAFEFHELRLLINHFAYFDKKRQQGITGKK